MKIFSTRFTATVSRLGAYVNGISTFSSVGTVTGNLRALDPEAASKNGFQYGNAFTFITEIGVDIRPSDKLTINGTTYTVSGVSSYGLASDPTSYLKAVITDPE